MSNTDHSARRRLESAGELFGLNHSRFLKNLEHRVNNLCNREKYGEAESACLEALEKTERVFGEKCIELVPVLKHLQAICSCRGMYLKAEEFSRRALSIIDEAHPDYMEFADTLAAVKARSGRHDEAETLYKQLLSIKERAVGPHHPHLIEWLNQLAVFYADRERFHDAEPYLQRVLEIVQDCAGDDICSISVAMFNLASLYSCRRDYRKTEFFISRALRMRRQLSDNDSCLRELATVLVKQGRYAEAERILNRCLTQVQHPMFDLDCMIWLVIVYELQDQAGKAERMYRKVISTIRSESGLVFPVHLDALVDLADLCASRGSDERAAEVYKFALELVDREYGDDPFCLMESLKDLADFYESRERFDKAGPFLERMMAIVKQSFGSEHPMVRELIGRMGRKETANRPEFPRPRFDCNYILMKEKSV